jgi:hypothetical protein
MERLLAKSDFIFKVNVRQHDQSKVHLVPKLPCDGICSSCNTEIWELGIVKRTVLFWVIVH